MHGKSQNVSLVLRETKHNQARGWIMEHSFSRPFVPTVELSFSGTNVPGNEWFRERKFHHWNEESWERIVLKTNVADTKKLLLVVVQQWFLPVHDKASARWRRLAAATAELCVSRFRFHRALECDSGVDKSRESWWRLQVQWPGVFSGQSVDSCMRAWSSLTHAIMAELNARLSTLLMWRHGTPAPLCSGMRARSSRWPIVAERNNV